MGGPTTFYTVGFPEIQEPNTGERDCAGRHPEFKFTYRSIVSLKKKKKKSYLTSQSCLETLLMEAKKKNELRLTYKDRKYLQV